jgi:hypothetical protein
LEGQGKRGKTGETGEEFDFVETESAGFIRELVGDRFVDDRTRKTSPTTALSPVSPVSQIVPLGIQSGQ